MSLRKLGNSLMVGQFSLGLAIATPILVFTNLYFSRGPRTDVATLPGFRSISDYASY